jgi:hypothetical protein
MGKSVQFQGIKMHGENAKSRYYLLDNESLKKTICYVFILKVEIDRGFLEK